MNVAQSKVLIQVVCAICCSEWWGDQTVSNHLPFSSCTMWLRCYMDTWQLLKGNVKRSPAISVYRDRSFIRRWCDSCVNTSVVRERKPKVKLNLGFWMMTSKWRMTHCNQLWLTECSSCWPLSVHPPPSLRPTLPLSQSSPSTTDICSVGDACVSVSHSFPWSLVLFWLCSCFPLRSGTPDDGRPRYELYSFYPPFLHCPSHSHCALKSVLPLTLCVVPGLEAAQIWAVIFAFWTT